MAAPSHRTNEMQFTKVILAVAAAGFVAAEAQAQPEGEATFGLVWCFLFPWKCHGGGGGDPNPPPKPTTSTPPPKPTTSNLPPSLPPPTPRSLLARAPRR